MNLFYSILRDEEYKTHVEKKGEYDYLSWAVCHDKLKNAFNYVEYIVHEYQVTLQDGAMLTLPYMLLPNGTAMVKVTLKCMDSEGDEHQHTECLAVRDYRMNATSAPDSAQVENTIRRCIAKAASMLTGYGIELWFGEDIKDLDYRQETLVNGRVPTTGHITPEQSRKLDRLMRNPLITANDTALDESGATAKKVVEFMTKNPTFDETETAINKLQQKIAELKEAEKETE